MQEFSKEGLWTLRELFLQTIRALSAWQDDGPHVFQNECAFVPGSLHSSLIQVRDDSTNFSEKRPSPCFSPVVLGDDQFIVLRNERVHVPMGEETRPSIRVFL